MDGSEPHIVLLGGDGGRSGVPTYLSHMVAALQGRARLTVITDTNRGGYDFLKGLPLRHLEIPGLRSSANPLRVLRAWRALRRAIAESEADLVWSHARLAGYLVRVLGLGRRLPPLAVTHHSLPFEPGQQRLVATVARLAEAALMRIAPPHHVIHLTQSAAERYSSGVGHGAMARHAGAILGNCSRLGPMPGLRRTGPERVIVMTGRHGYQKNLLAGAYLLAHLPPDFRMVLCGTGTDSAVFQRAFLQISGRAASVSFLGPVADVRPVLAGADLFLMTSRYEGMPIAALEAFEAGLPLALPDIPGVAEIVAAHPLALTFDPDDPRRSAARVARLADAWAADRDANSAAIRAAWGAGFCFDIWRGDLLALLDRMRGPGGDFRI